MRDHCFQKTSTESVIKHLLDHFCSQTKVDGNNLRWKWQKILTITGRIWYSKTGNVVLLCSHARSVPVSFMQCVHPDWDTGRNDHFPASSPGRNRYVLEWFDFQDQTDQTADWTCHGDCENSGKWCLHLLRDLSMLQCSVYSRHFKNKNTSAWYAPNLCFTSTHWMQKLHITNVAVFKSVLHFLSHLCRQKVWKFANHRRCINNK